MTRALLKLVRTGRLAATILTLLVTLALSSAGLAQHRAALTPSAEPGSVAVTASAAEVSAYAFDGAGTPGTTKRTPASAGRLV